MEQKSISPWKLRLLALSLGVLVLAVVYAQAVLISNDARLMYVTGAVLLFGAAVLLGRKQNSNWFDVILLCVPIFVVFFYSVLDTMLLLWPHLLFWAVVAGIGFIASRLARSRASLAGAILILLIASVWYCGWYMPDRLARKFNRFGNTSAPAFALQSVGDRSAPLSPTPGKILVIDFFSTTCVPCIAELPQISAVRGELSQNRDIDFVLVASEKGRDTPEGFRSFVERRHVTIPLAFDPEGKVYDSFGFKGIPALVVLDRTGRVRLTRQGYNPADANFRRDLVAFLKSL